VSAVRDADRITGLIEAAEKGPGRLILNRIKPELVKKGEMLSSDDVIDILGLSIIGIIPEDELVLSASNSGVPVTLNTDSKAGMAFNNVARRLIGEDVPFMNLDDDAGFFRRLARLIEGW
jgi:septum site-determining protein MinD